MLMAFEEKFTVDFIGNNNDTMFYGNITQLG